jgi:RecA/RadA recombinase
MKASMKQALNEAAEDLDKPVRLVINDSTVLDSGSTLMNLKATGRVDACFVKGGYYFIVGDSSSGKTFISMTCLGEAAQNKNFEGYRFIFDNNEDGAHFDFAKFFGAKMEKRLEEPHNGVSDTVDDFYFNIDDAFITMLGGSRCPKGKTVKRKVTGDGRPFIYILDSQDGLSSKYEVAKFEEKKDAKAKGKDAKGSYGDGKAKIHSENIRRVCKEFAKHGCILIVLGQTRDNPDAGMFESNKTRSGGKALRFYAHIEIWTSVMKQLKKTVKGKDRKIGTRTKLDFTKNRFTGNTGADMSLCIYRKFGIDDIGDIIDYCIEEKHWQTTGEKGAKQKIVAEALDFEGTRKELIKYIEDDDLYDELREEAQECFNDIEEALGSEFIGRKARYE